ncbi:MAG: hypothetical protein IPG46_18365 [Actinobacteria bacterium]|nr:hypothetical protein [Actinomycetota bacterium]
MLVSHDMWMIQEMCERVLYLDHGRSVFLGDSMEGVNKYLHDLSSDRSDEVDDPLIVPDHSPVKVLELTATGDDGEIPSQGRAMEVACTVDASEAFDVRWGIEIASVDQPVVVPSVVADGPADPARRRRANDPCASSDRPARWRSLLPESCGLRRDDRPAARLERLERMAHRARNSQRGRDARQPPPNRANAAHHVVGGAVSVAHVPHST